MLFRSPEHKGKVERGVDYVQENAIKGMTFESLALQNQHLFQREKNVADTRIHGTTKKHVGKQFIEVEKQTLGTLPPECLVPAWAPVATYSLNRYSLQPSSAPKRKNSWVTLNRSTIIGFSVIMLG